VGAVATGGAAAAATGHLPGPVREVARSILAPLGDGAPAPPSGPGSPSEPGSPPGPVATGGPASAGATTGPQGSQATGTTVRGPASTAAGSVASQETEGLCRAYLAGEGAEQGKKLEAPALRALARAAGGAEKIDDYCAELLPDQAKPKDKKDQPPPGGQGQEQEQENGQGQGGPPASTGAGNQGQPAPDDRSPRR
jgi:hypothetical protein